MNELVIAALQTPVARLLHSVRGWVHALAAAGIVPPLSEGTRRVVGLQFQMGFPKKYRPAEAPAGLLELVDRLVPLLIEGDHPALAALREQFPRARITEVELTGVGFYVDFEVPSDLPLAEPADFAGGDATITLEGASLPAGCVLFVRDGRLATLEGYTYDDPWPEDAVVLAVEDVVPVHPGRVTEQL